jgi:adenine phosphoribosyltransferase
MSTNTPAGSFDFASLIVDIPDYPTPGVVFKDITPVLADADAFAAVVDGLAGHFAGRGVTKVLGAEARGFVVGAPVAARMGVGFVPARKPGKLPRATVSESYDLEYGSNTIEIHEDALGPDDVVLIVDDLVATGGTAEAQVRLVERAGAKVAGLGFFMELAFLGPRAKLAAATDAEVFSLYVVE